jgi:hypothetical protein
LVAGAGVGEQGVVDLHLGVAEGDLGFGCGYWDNALGGLPTYG